MVRGGALEPGQATLGVPDLDQGQPDGMLEGRLGIFLQGTEEKPDRFPVANPSQGSGGHPAYGGILVGQGLCKDWYGFTDPEFSQGARGCPPDFHGRVLQGGTELLADPGNAQLRDGEDGPSANVGIPGEIWRAELREGFEGTFPQGDELCLGPVTHGRAGIAKQFGEVRDGQLVPLDFRAPGIGRGGSLLPADPVDRTEHLGLGGLGVRTPPAQPASRVQQEQTPVRIFQNISGMKVPAGGGEEIPVPRGEGGTVGNEPDVTHPVGIEVAGEEGVTVVIAELRSAVAHQSGRGDLSPANGGGNAVAGFREEGLAVESLGESTGKPVNECVMALAAKAVVDGGGGKDFTASGEGDVDRVDRSLPVDSHVAPVRATGEDSARPALPGPAAVRSGELITEVAAAEVESTIGAEVGAVLVGPAIELHLPDDFLTFVGHAVVVRVLQSPEVRGGDDVKGPVVPEATLRHGHSVSKNGALVEDAVAICIGEAAHEARAFLFDLLAGGEIASVAFGHIKTAFVVEAGHHGILEKRGSGSEGNFESVPHLERRRLEGFILAGCADYSSPQQSGYRQSTQRCEVLPLACLAGGW